MGGCPETGMPTTPMYLHAGPPNIGGGRVHGGQCYMLRDGPRCGGDPVATQPVAGRAGVTLATCLLMVATKRSWVVWAVGASPLRHP